MPERRKVVIIGSDEAANALEGAALHPYAVTKSVIRLPSIAAKLPPTLAETIPQLPPQPGSFAVVCSGYTCGLPISSADDLRQALKP